MEILRLEKANMSGCKYWRCIMSGQHSAYSYSTYGAIAYGDTMQQAMLSAAQQQFKAHNIAVLREIGKK